MADDQGRRARRSGLSRGDTVVIRDGYGVACGLARALNEPSRSAVQRLGFSYEGTPRRHVVTRGRSRDTAWLALTDQEWPRIAAGCARWLAEQNFLDGVQVRSRRDLLGR